MTTSRTGIRALWVTAVIATLVVGALLAHSWRESDRSSSDGTLSEAESAPVGMPVGVENTPLATAATDTTTGTAGPTPTPGSGPLSYAQQFHRAANLSRLLLEAELRASQGDSEAQAVVARIYEECARQSVFPNDLEDQYAGAVSTAPDKQAALRAAADFLARRCAGVVVPGGIESIADAYRRAGDMGSVSALLRAAAFDGAFEALSDADLDALIADAVRHRDADAYLALSDLLGYRSEERKLSASGLYGTPMQGAAWELAGCRLGADCGSNSARLHQMCLTNGVCGYPSLEAYYRAEAFSPADWQRVEQLVAAILGARSDVIKSGKGSWGP